MARRVYTEERWDLSQPVKNITYEVEPEDHGVRLDRFLSDCIYWRSRTFFQNHIRDGRAEVNGAVCRKVSLKLQEGDIVVFNVPPHEEDPSAMESIEYDTFYEDRWIIGVNKPPDLVVHPTGRRRYSTLLNALHKKYVDGDPNSPVSPILVHRIDKDTSGLILVAKTEKLAANLGIQFERRRVKKQYLCIVEGEPETDRFTVDLPLDSPTGRPTTPVNSSAKKHQAKTDFTVEKRLGGFALVRAEPHTGRRHQIRVHLQSAGHPIVCDKNYGFRETLTLRDVAETTCRLSGRDSNLLLAELRDLGGPETVVMPRMALHSARLRFIHPHIAKPMTLEAPLLGDFKAAMYILEQAAANIGMA